MNDRDRTIRRRQHVLVLGVGIVTAALLIIPMFFGH